MQKIIHFAISANAKLILSGEKFLCSNQEKTVWDWPYFFLMEDFERNNAIAHRLRAGLLIGMQFDVDLPCHTIDANKPELIYSDKYSQNILYIIHHANHRHAAIKSGSDALIVNEICAIEVSGTTFDKKAVPEGFEPFKGARIEFVPKTFVT